MTSKLTEVVVEEMFETAVGTIAVDVVVALVPLGHEDGPDAASGTPHRAGSPNHATLASFQVPEVASIPGTTTGRCVSPSTIGELWMRYTDHVVFVVALPFAGQGPELATLLSIGSLSACVVTEELVAMKYFTPKIWSC